MKFKRKQEKSTENRIFFTPKGYRNVFLWKTLEKNFFHFSRNWRTFCKFALLGNKRRYYKFLFFQLVVFLSLTNCFWLSGVLKTNFNFFFRIQVQQNKKLNEKVLIVRKKSGKRNNYWTLDNKLIFLFPSLLVLLMEEVKKI